MTKRLGLGALGALALGALAAYGTRPASKPVPAPAPAPAPTAVTPAEPAGAVAAAPRAVGCRFAVGDTLAYTIASRASLRLDAKTLGAPAGTDLAPLERTVRVVLDLRALSTDDAAGAVVLARYREADPQTKLAGGGLTAPFLLRVAPTCELTGFARLEGTPTSDARTAQALAYELSFAWPVTDGAVFTGENSRGTFRATTRIRSAEPAVLAREIVAYTRTWEDVWRGGGDGVAREVRPLRSERRVLPGAGPWLESLEESEVVPNALGGQTESATSVVRVAAMSETLAGAPTDGRRYVWEDLLPKKPKAPAEAVLSRADKAALAAMKDVTLPEAKAAFEERVAREENVSRQWPALTAFLRAHPETTRTFADELVSGGVSDGAVAAGYIALGQTPTTEARDALLGIQGNGSNPVIHRANAVFALVQREDVGVDFARSLHTAALAISTGASRPERLFAREAALALGAMGGLRPDDADIVAEARSGVRELLGNGRTPAALRPAFKALANLGDPTLLTLLTPYVRHSDPKMRAAAAIAVRRMAPRDTVELSAHWLATEPDPDVKRELYRTLRLQHFDAQAIPAEAIVTRAAADLDSHPGVPTRQSLVNLLGAAAATSPEARAALLRDVPYEMSQKQGIEELLGTFLTAGEMAAAEKAAEVTK